MSARWPDAAGRDRLLVVDGHAYAYRAYYAIRGLTDQNGRPTGAIYGFIKMLQKMEQLIRPTHVVVIWDGGLSEERIGLLKDYKAHRPPLPDELSWQICEITKYLKYAGAVSMCQDGTEADDWIAVAARQAVLAGMQAVVASSDKDFFQLISDKIGLLNPNDQTPVIWDEMSVVKKTGVLPDQIVDWLAMVGDSVDNIEGVRGIGTKTAANLLKQFGSIEGIKANLHLMTGSVARKLTGAFELVERNKQLVRLPENLDVRFDVRDWVRQAPDIGALKRLYEQWRFKGLLSELSETMQQVFL